MRQYCCGADRTCRVHPAQWVSRVEKSSLLQERMLLSELFQPQIMINALKQQTARTRFAVASALAAHTRACMSLVRLLQAS